MKELENINYEEDIRIDPEMLDFEWNEQAEKMLKYSTIAANTAHKVDLAKENLDIVKAELSRDIRIDPDKFNIDSKLTESIVENTIILQSEYIAANHALLEAKYLADMAKGAVRAFDQRKDALENLVRLLGQQYFAGPKTPHDVSQWKKKDNPVISLKRNK